MGSLLQLFGVVAFVVAAGFFATSRQTGSAVHEIEAILMVIVGAVLFVGGAIVGRMASVTDEIRGWRTDLQAAKSRPAASAVPDFENIR